MQENLAKIPEIPYTSNAHPQHKYASLQSLHDATSADALHPLEVLVVSIYRRKDTKATHWCVHYVDGTGKRRTKGGFATKRAAKTWSENANVGVRLGTHVPDTATCTVADAAALWLSTGKAASLEQSTIDQRRQHIDIHIVPFLGTLRLTKVTVPVIRAWQDDLRSSGRSLDMISRVTASLGGILGEAMERGFTAANPVRNMKRRSGTAAVRSKRRLQIGIDIPHPQEVAAVCAALGTAPLCRWRPLLLTAIFTGMRASELRGLKWCDVDLAAGLIHVRRRVDRYGQEGPPKSAAGRRTIPIPAELVRVLREHRLASPFSQPDDLVFPTGRGRPESLGNIVNRALIPACIQAGLTEDGNAVLKARYTGMHALRHFYASWCINPPSAGGLGLPLKAVQERLGHATLAMTADTYGHLFPADASASVILDSGASTLLGSVVTK